jgi:lipopolysaccharide export system permease protein
MARICMYLFPIGIIFKLISFLFERRISNDLLTIKKLNGELLQLINEAVKAESIAV